MNILVSIFPVLVFLAALIFLDSYKLVKLKWVVLTILLGCLVALIAFWINSSLLERSDVDEQLFSRYAAPVIEEILKASFILYLIQSQKVGFMVDSAIYGFAIGAGFACVENIYYVHSLESSSIILWIIRGFGTAVMHGGTTAIFGVISKNLSDRFPSKGVLIFIPGLVVMVLIHSVFNHFFLPPIIETVVMLIVLPLIMLLVFRQSEQSTRTWLGVGLDADMELLHQITHGDLLESNIGKYLHSLREKFPGEMIIDMLCLLRLHTELAIRSKGILMMREAGFSSPPDTEIVEKFKELNYLEKSIGTTGKIAITPFLHTSKRDLWQIYMLE